MIKQVHLILGFSIAVFIAAFFVDIAFAQRDYDVVMQKIEKKGEPLKTIPKPNIEYKAEGLRDPFESFEPVDLSTAGKGKAVAKEEKLPPLYVQGVVWGSKLPQAIINNKVVKVGDTIEGMQIVEINREGIKIIFENREYSVPSPGLLSLQDLEKKKDSFAK